MSQEPRVVYLDNAATTRVRDEVAEAMTRAMVEQYGNPSSLHQAGRGARGMVEEARFLFSTHLGVPVRDCIFLSGGTEANNLAVLGYAYANQDMGRHIITSNFEHPAILAPCRKLAEEGFDVTFVPVTRDGVVKAQDVIDAMRDDTILVSIMLVNNELGTIQPVPEIGAEARKRGIVMHTDAVQALGKLDLSVDALNVDMVSISSHKIHGPKGVGMLYCRNGLALDPRQHGGSQEFKVRSGTENVPGIVGFGKAFELALAEWEQQEAVAGLRDRLERGILEAFPDAIVNGGASNRVGPILNIAIPGTDGEAMILGLDEHGICISAGSACSSGSTELSHVLTAIQLDPEVGKGSIRLSLCRTMNESDVDYALAKIIEVAKRLRALSPVHGSQQTI
jgi:cysteine desulfurase